MLILAMIQGIMVFTVTSSLSEKAVAPHSSTLAWRVPWTEEPGGLQSMGSRRVRHDWATSLSLFTFMHWRRKWQPTPVFLPGESQERGEPGGLPSMGSHRVGHDWSDLAAAAAAAVILVFLKWGRVGQVLPCTNLRKFPSWKQTMIQVRLASTNKLNWICLSGEAGFVWVGK